MSFTWSPGAQAGQPRGRNGETRVRRRGRRTGRRLRSQPYPCGSRDPPVDIAAWANPDHCRSRLKRPRAQFRPCQIHDDPAGSPQRLLGPPQMFDHPQPRRGVVMSAIDAHAVHALLKQAVNEGVIVCRLARHGDHNPDPAPGGGGTQQTLPCARQAAVARRRNRRLAPLARRLRLRRAGAIPPGGAGLPEPRRPWPERATRPGRGRKAPARPTASCNGRRSRRRRAR